MKNKKIHAAIITIGDEILIGQIVDTNSAWLGQELGKMGIRVSFRNSIGDNKAHIIDALNQASKYADLIITTGGLGPTKDDVTKQTFCEYFNTQLIQNQKVYEWVKDIFTKRNLPLLETNIFQSMVPQNCEVLFNHVGTAPGMWFNHNNKIYISMPGVPFEMKHIFESHCISKIKSHFTLPSIIHRTIQTASIGESFLAEKIKIWEENLPQHINLAYLPSVGQVRLRLSGYSDEPELLQEEIRACIESLYDIAGEYIYGEENDTLQQVVGQLLLNQNYRLATAESCTGGYLSHLITSISGSSAYYQGSIIAYNNQIKINELNVSPDILTNYGAVSEECVKAMAQNLIQKWNVDCAIATSGVAGPTGGSAQKPVGTVWIAVATPNNTIAKVFNMGDNRERTILRSALQGLDMLRKALLTDK
jgi:nicotinamide-nucleotide amidase